MSTLLSSALSFFLSPLALSVYFPLSLSLSFYFSLSLPLTTSRISPLAHSPSPSDPLTLLIHSFIRRSSCAILIVRLSHAGTASGSRHGWSAATKSRSKSTSKAGKKPIFFVCNVIAYRFTNHPRTVQERKVGRSHPNNRREGTHRHPSHVEWWYRHTDKLLYTYRQMGSMLAEYALL